MPSRRAFFAIAFLTIVAAWPAPRVFAQARAEVIRGRVTSDSGRAIVGADVIATMSPNRDVFRTSSDSNGRYELDVAAGTGDYLLYIGAVGRRPFRKRITRSGTDSVFVVDASLPREVTAVAPVRTTAQRTRVPRADDAPANVGSLTTQFGGVAGALSPDQMGDLAAMAATVPGVSVTPGGGISVFGVDPSQNRTTLTGLTFDGAALPRDLPTRTRVSSSVYDPTLGGFGGVLVAVDIVPGQALTFGRGHLSLDAPQLQAADATARELGQRYERFQSGYGRSGELSQDLWVYDGSIEGSRTTFTAPSILTADRSALERLGVAFDSASRFVSLLGGSGIPTRVGGIGSDVVSTSVSGAVRVDRTPSYPFGGSPADANARGGFVAFGAFNRSDPASASALSPPARDQVNTSGSAAIQAFVSQYFGAGGAYLSETKTGVSFNTRQSRPALALPSGGVLVTSALSDGSNGVSALQFGGAPSMTDTRSWRWEAANELSFDPINHPTHRIKILTQGQIDGYHEASRSNALGTFSYNSLADFQANTPSEFTRTLFTPDRNGGEASGAFAIADYLTRSPDLQFVFGPRLEWSRFLRAPRENPAVAHDFGANTAFTPGGMHVSPRFGFTWFYPGPRRTSRGGMASSSLGTQFIPAKGVLRGGIGEFRAPYAPALLSNAAVSTGLRGTTTQRLSCLGPAVPVRAWSALAAGAVSAPSACAGGSGAGIFADSAPAIEVFDPSFTASRRWTANLTWVSAYKQLFYTIDLSHSLNLDQPGMVDLNYTGVRRFSLSNEADRPVFVDPGSIVPTTGLLSPLDARESSAFGRVLSRRSDLRTEVTQATVSFLPYMPQRLARLMANASYTYATSRSLSRGFDGTTLGDPTTREWSSGFMPHHQVRMQLGYWLRRPLDWFFTTYWSVQSGYPYTPLVSGDVNGDGLANDRAFVFNPSAAPTATIANEMRTLLASTTSEARDCLSRQFGSTAMQNSCRRPWTATMNARLTWGHRFGDLYHYVQGSVNFANPLSGLDDLLHGANHLRGWGAPAAPDATLLYVRGFDPATRQFIYEVNPRFGNTRPSLGAFLNPFRVTLDFTFSLTGNAQRQQLNIFLRPTRSAPGQRPPVDTVLKRLRSTGATPLSPYYWMIANADSLLLSPEQMRSLTDGAARRNVQIDSLYGTLARELAALPEEYDADAVMRRVQQVNQSVFGWPDSESAFIRGVLTPIQFRLLPPVIVSMLTPPPARPGRPPDR
jgi:hypothetical protein